MEKFAQKIESIQISQNQAEFLKSLIKMHRATAILEIGTLHGFSALNFAQAVAEVNANLPANMASSSVHNEGSVMCIEKNEENLKIAQENLKNCKNVKLILGDAQEVLTQMLNESQKFNFIFIDANKSQYLTYLEMSINLLSDNGIIVADNTLFRGYVFGKTCPKRYERIVCELRKFHEYIDKLKGFKAITLNVEDGITILQKN